jgi:hypothetical protein
MAAKSTNRIIALLSVLTLAGLTAALVSRRNTGNAEEQPLDQTEFPLQRAHVYYAAPDAVLKAATLSTSALGDLAIEKAAESSLVVSIPGQNSSQSSTLSIETQMLGDRHTRVIIRPLNAADHGTVEDLGRSIRQIQAAMDNLLTGG